MEPAGSSWTSNSTPMKLKEELKQCMEKLNCSIVVMKGSEPKVLRLNLGYSDEPQTPFFSATSSPCLDSGRFQSFRMKHSTPISSPEYASTSYSTVTGDGSFPTPDVTASPYLVYEQNPLFEGSNRGKQTPMYSPLSTLESDKGTQPIYPSTESSRFFSSNRYNVFQSPEKRSYNEKTSLLVGGRKSYDTRPPSSKFVIDKFVQEDRDMSNGILGLEQSSHVIANNNSSIRDAVSMAKTSSAPPPLCSICQHKAPTFGKPPRRFAYEELLDATNGFSDMNLLAEGGFGLVHKGILRNGQVVAVKLLKFVGSQGDADFCREVRVLSCAQHRNVVLLIGFCIEGKKRMLVYEYICNRSLDFHLHGNKKTTLDLRSRLKIAIGAARGLRYLHEDCRVGCIIHRDMRPNNILLTHDFEPLVGDFGLARLHCEWNIGMEQQVIGATGYLAPEYIDGGSITEKIDVYAFGVVLVELITGQKIKELQRNKGWSSFLHLLDPLSALEPNHIVAENSQSLKSNFIPDQDKKVPYEIQIMGRAACLCLRRDPESRPPMSKVLRILEGGNAPVPLGMDLNSVGSQSGHMQGLSSRRESESGKCHSRKLSH